MVVHIDAFVLVEVTLLEDIVGQRLTVHTDRLRVPEVLSSC